MSFLGWEGHLKLTPEHKKGGAAKFMASMVGALDLPLGSLESTRGLSRRIYQIQLLVGSDPT